MQWWWVSGAMALAAASWLGQAAGGTLVVRLGDNPVQPVVLTVRGPVDRDITVDGARDVTVRGLPVGRYDVRPVFAGAIPGSPVVALVDQGRTALVDVPLDGLGGVRFDADPGMCEPWHEWSITSVAIRWPQDEPPARRLDVPLPSSRTCLRELGGLAPGTYRVTVVPPPHDLPMFSAIVRVEAGVWTVHRMALPPVIVRGRVTSNGEPLTGVQVTFIPTPATLQAWRSPPPQMSFSGAMSDTGGRYAAALNEPGAYRQVLRPIGQDPLPERPGEVAVGPGVNLHDIEVGGATLRVWFTEHGTPLAPDRAVTLTMQSLPERPFTPPVRSSEGPVTVRLITPGRYTVSATAQYVDADGRPVTLVSERQTSLTIASMTTSDLTVNLIRRDATWLEVRHADGTLGEGAYVVPLPGAPSLRAGEDGRVSLETVPVGTPLTIRTRAWGVTCHAVTLDPLQRIVVPDASEMLVLTWSRNGDVQMARAALGGAVLAGIPGATCAVPFEGLSVGESRVTGRVELRAQLPPGAYTLTLRDGRTLTMVAPGRYEIP